MKTNQRISVLISIIAVSASLTSVAHARMFSPQHVAQTVGDAPNPVFSFDVHCDVHGGTGTTFPGWDRSDNEQASEFLPQCTLSGNQDGATFQCECKDNGAAIVGEIDREEILPEGLLPPVGSVFPALEPIEVALRACRSVLTAQCTSRPQDIDVHCSDESGTCFVHAFGLEASQGYLGVSSECLCDSGALWMSQDLATQARSLDQEQAVKLCQSELHGCAPQGEPGPSDVEFFPQSNVGIRLVACADYDAEDMDFPECYVDDDGEQVTYACHCSADGEPLEGELAVDSYLSRAQLHDQCRVVLASKCTDTPELPDEATPKVPEAPNIDDIIGDLGCNLGEAGPLRPWMLPGWALCLFAFRRRR